MKEVKEVKKTVKEEEVEVAVEGWEDEYLRNDRWIVHQFGREKLFLDLLPRRMMPIAEQLLDGAIVQPVDDAPVNSRCPHTHTSHCSTLVHAFSIWYFDWVGFS